MPRNARCVVPELAYHVTQRGTNRQRVFFSAADRATYLRLLQQNLEPIETRVLAWCLGTLEPGDSPRLSLELSVPGEPGESESQPFPH